MPECMQGAVTIRNELIPVFDIKRRLALPAVDVTPKPNILYSTQQGKLAIVADDVSKIVKAEGNEVQNFRRCYRQTTHPTRSLLSKTEVR